MKKGRKEKKLTGSLFLSFEEEDDLCCGIPHVVEGEAEVVPVLVLKVRIVDEWSPILVLLVQKHLRLLRMHRLNS